MYPTGYRHRTASRRSLCVCLLVNAEQVRYFVLQHYKRLLRYIEVQAARNHDTTRREE